MSSIPLNCISPIDGRYSKKTIRLQKYFSEAALIKYRIQVEIEYFIALCNSSIPQLNDFPNKKYTLLRDLYKNFSISDAKRIKEIETKTNPTVISENWEPSEDCMDIIEMAGIDNNFVEESLPEFKLYWKEDGRASVSWDSKFINFIKKRASFFDGAAVKQNKPSFNWYNPYEDENDKKKSNNKILENLRKKHKI